MVYLYNGILHGHKKGGNITFRDSMDGPEENCVQWNKHRKTSTIWFYSYVESNKQNKLTNKIETDS